MYVYCSVIVLCTSKEKQVDKKQKQCSTVLFVLEPWQGPIPNNRTLTMLK